MLVDGCCPVVVTVLSVLAQGLSSEPQLVSTFPSALYSILEFRWSCHKTVGANVFNPCGTAAAAAFKPCNISPDSALLPDWTSTLPYWNWFVIFERAGGI